MFRKIPVLGASLAVATLLLGTVGLSIAGEVKIVKVRDACEMASFDAMFGPGTCQQEEGKVTVGSFLAYVIQHHDHPLWRFNPESFDLPVGKQLVLENLGGEFHTWTEVVEFGGGIILPLNFGQATRPECGSPFVLAAPGPKNIFLEFGDVEVGPTAGSADLPGGEHKFMCCIHPWMRTTVHVH